MKLASCHNTSDLEEDLQKRLKRDFPGVQNGMLRVNPGGWLCPTRFLKFADKIYNFGFKESDVVVLMYPKCGTTWTQEIIWTMRNNPNLDHPRANLPTIVRSPFIEFDMLMSSPKSPFGSPMKNPLLKAFLEMCPGKNSDDGVTLQLTEACPDPRTIKTHLPFSLMPPSMLDTAKVVYVARNPKDVITSFHHHCKINELLNFVGTFHDYVQYFVDGDVVYGHYWLHLKEAWEKKGHPNLHIIFYEDLKANPLHEIKKLDTFLDTHLTEKQLEGIVKYTSFSEMKARSESHNSSTPQNVGENPEKSENEIKRQEYTKKEGGFFRKGQVGDWKSKFTPELDAKVNQWIENNINPSGFNFKYGI